MNCWDGCSIWVRYRGADTALLSGTLTLRRLDDLAIGEAVLLGEIGLQLLDLIVDGCLVLLDWKDGFCDCFSQWGGIC